MKSRHQTYGPHLGHDQETADLPPRLIYENVGIHEIRH
jgi:hypothetical protein